jgi:phenylpyruvate tautomerase PptA (4-oxalocrotonate tautomerase family)
MKRSLLLAFALVFSALTILGQSPKKTHWMMVSVFENASLIPHSTTNILVTRDDGTQKLTVIKRISEYSLKHFKENEDSVFAMLQPFFADGWKLTSTTTIPITQGVPGFDYLTRYFFCKEDAE